MLTIAVLYLPGYTPAIFAYLLYIQIVELLAQLSERTTCHFLNVIGTKDFYGVIFRLP